MEKLLGLLPLALVIAIVWVFVVAFGRVARRYARPTPRAWCIRGVSPC